MWCSRTCSLIIPAKNERENLAVLLDGIPRFVDEVLVVVGDSSDGTAEFAETHPAVDRVIRQRSKGKGAAMSRGLKESTSELIFFVDADGSMELEELESFAEALCNGGDLVKGSRFLPGGGSDDITPFRSLGNKALTTLANFLFEVSWTDLAYGYIGFRREALAELEVSHIDNKVPGKIALRRLSYGQGFEIETLLLCRASRRGLKIIEIPSWEKSRRYGSSNLNAISDGFRALAALLLERARSKRFKDEVEFNQ